MDGGAGVASVSSSLDRVYSSVGQVLVAANAIDETGRTGFASMQVTVYEPGDDCSTPRVIPGDGPWPYTILTENRTATIGPEDPVVECTTWPGDPDSGRWRSIWLEFTPSDERHLHLQHLRIGPRHRPLGLDRARLRTSAGDRRGLPRRRPTQPLSRS